MFDIQRVPKGLLSLLGSQANGATPRALSPSIAGVVPLLEMYGAELIVTQFGQTAALAVVGANHVLTVPSGESWYVKYAAARFEASAVGTVLNGFIGVAAQSGGTTVPLAASSKVTATAISEEVVAASQDMQLVLSPGAALVAQLSSPSAVGTVTAKVLALVYRLPV